MRKLSVTMRELFVLTAIAAVAVAWWIDRRHLTAEIAALRQANGALPGGIVFGTAGVAGPRVVHPNRCNTPAEFIQALRETKDWYEFADRTADPFAKTPIADETIPALIELLADPEADVRTRALCTLGKIHRHAAEVVPAIIPCLEDPGPNVRWHAAFALGQFGAESAPAIPALRRQVESDESPIAALSAGMLRKIDPSVDVESLLIRQLGSANIETRRRALTALSNSPGPSAKPALVEAYRRETDPQLRNSLAKAIAAIDAGTSNVAAP